ISREQYLHCGGFFPPAERELFEGAEYCAGFFNGALLPPGGIKSDPPDDSELPEGNEDPLGPWKWELDEERELDDNDEPLDADEEDPELEELRLGGMVRPPGNNQANGRKRFPPGALWSGRRSCILTAALAPPKIAVRMFCRPGMELRRITSSTLETA